VQTIAVELALTVSPTGQIGPLARNAENANIGIHRLSDFPVLCQLASLREAQPITNHRSPLTLHLSERCTDNHTDGEVDDRPSHRKISEFFEEGHSF
jgi:hypothetical protein